MRRTVKTTRAKRAQLFLNCLPAWLCIVRITRMLYPAIEVRQEACSFKGLESDSPWAASVSHFLPPFELSVGVEHQTQIMPRRRGSDRLSHPHPNPRPIHPCSEAYRKLRTAF